MAAVFILNAQFLGIMSAAAVSILNSRFVCIMSDSWNMMAWALHIFIMNLGIVIIIHMAAGVYVIPMIAAVIYSIVL